MSDIEFFTPGGGSGGGIPNDGSVTNVKVASNAGITAGKIQVTGAGSLPTGTLQAVLVGSIEDRRVTAGANASLNVVAGFSGNQAVSGTNVVTPIDASIVAGGGHATYPNQINNGGVAQTIAGGYDQIIDADQIGACTISGGGHNRITGAATHGTIGGGSYNLVVDCNYSVIAGGTTNAIMADGATVGGGSKNVIDSAALNGVIGGGVSGVQHGNSGALLGGNGNAVLGNAGTSGGGTTNVNVGNSAVLVGGASNQLGDVRRVTDAVMTAGSAILASATAAFVLGDVGETVIVLGAGANPAGGAGIGAPLTTTIAGFTDASHVTLTVAATTAVTGATAFVLTGLAYGSSAVLGGGLSNLLGTTASAQYGVLGGGRLNQVQALYGVVPGGHENQVTADNGRAEGFGAIADKYGQQARASGYFAAAGDAQASDLLLRRQTTNNTATELRLDGSAQRLVLTDLSTYRVEIRVIARRVDTRTPASDATFLFTGIATRESGVATVTWTPADQESFAGTTGYVLGVTADTTNGAISIKGTGATGQTVNWLADVKLVKVTG